VKIRDALGFIGILILMGYGFLVQATWLAAWLSGDYEIAVAINQYGEASIELFLIPFTLLLGIWGIYRYFHELIYRGVQKV